MQDFSGYIPIAIAVTMVALVVVMFVGLYSMGRGGAAGSRKSNRMMRYRVGLQGFAIVLLLSMAFLASR